MEGKMKEGGRGGRDGGRKGEGGTEGGREGGRKGGREEGEGRGDCYTHSNKKNYNPMAPEYLNSKHVAYYVITYVGVYQWHDSI